MKPTVQIYKLAQALQTGLTQTSNDGKRRRFAKEKRNTPLAFTPSGVRNILSFFPAFPALDPLALNSCHLLFPASNSLFAFTFLGTLAGRMGPSLTLLGSLFAWLASVGLISAAAEMTPVDLAAAAAAAGVEAIVDGEAGDPSAFRFLESGCETGLMSAAERVSVVE